jgi:hypothetical protein
MTAISAPRVRTDATPVEHMLLSAASALDAFVTGRLERRTDTGRGHAYDVQRSFAAAREAAQARGAMGLLPR